MAEDVDIRLEQVCKGWSGTVAVADASFAVPRGEFVILLGPSGCGKSTTLRMISGLETPDSGRVIIHGRDVTREPPGKRGLSMVFQSYALFPHLSVADNIVFGLKSRGVPKPEQRERLGRVARLVGLQDLLERKPSQLSGGQRQRVALARAVIAEHPICLMDEPLSNLDARLRGEMRRELKALQRRLGMTVIYVTHDQVEAMSMGDRVVLMQDGRVEQDDAPARLYNCPQTMFAASFVGSPPMNLVDLVETADGGAFPGHVERPVVPTGYAPCTFGIRPEDIEILPASANGLAAAVVDCEYLGADTIARIQVGDEVLRARLTGRPDRLPAGACRVAWSADAVHLFDRESGARHSDALAFATGGQPSEAPATTSATN